jgi:glutamate synthase domain-containing protein 1
MNISNIAEKTNYLKMDNKEVKVSTLPESARFEVDTLDRLMQKRLDTLQELEFVELAIKAKQAQLRQIVIDLFPAKEESEDAR